MLRQINGHSYQVNNLEDNQPNLHEIPHEIVSCRCPRMTSARPSIKNEVQSVHEGCPSVELIHLTKSRVWYLIKKTECMQWKRFVENAGDTWRSRNVIIYSFDSHFKLQMTVVANGEVKGKYQEAAEGYQ